jgi:hypothetical protein
MNNYYAALRIGRIISYVVGDFGMVAATIIAFGTLRNAGQYPTFWVLVALVVPFVAAMGAKATGDLFGMWLDDEEESANVVRLPADSFDYNF